MIWLVILILIIGVSGYLRLPAKINQALLFTWLLLIPVTGGLQGWMWGLWSVVLLVLVLTAITPVRRLFISKPVMRFIKNSMPEISETEQQALESGDVWWDAELFSGKPDWNYLLALSSSRLSTKEKDFLNNQVDTLCSMLNDWEITHEYYDLPENVWDYIKKEKFFGMILPEEYGGLGFSARAHSEVIMKIASRSIAAAVTVMVPNSLGPGQLLLKYGTKKQQDYYMPRLVNGEEIPCFALTGPEAGSDASSIPDIGIVCEQGGELGIRLNWEKRYITLGPVATLIALAFHLYDPDHLLGQKEDIGISVALIPADHPGIQIGDRHFPLDIPFQNGPNRGENVFIPLDWLIGGREQAGQGWIMLVECLSEGRGISLPALSTGAAKLASRTTGAYARVRQQFGLPIGYFEGVEEPLARILGNTYLMDGARKLTVTGLDQGKTPAVITAMLKYQLTERMRDIINDAMDIQGGSGICLGPSNYIGRAYQAVPIAITVEGANILTRSLITFGQGAMRCHPYLQKEIQAAQNNDPEAFDITLQQHRMHIVSNLVRSIWFGLSNAMFEVSGTPCTRKHYRKLARLTANFALLSDYALLTLGSNLKRKEHISGRFADVFSNLYLCSATLKYFTDRGEPEADLPLLEYACRLTTHRAQQSMLAIFHNLPLAPIAKLLRACMFPFGKPYAPPNDALTHKVARLALEPSATRDRLTEGIYASDDPTDLTGRIEFALKAVIETAELEKQLRTFKKQGKITGHTKAELIEDAQVKNLLNKEEAEQLLSAWQAMREAVKVDAFPAEYFSTGGNMT